MRRHAPNTAALRSSHPVRSGPSDAPAGRVTRRGLAGVLWGAAGAAGGAAALAACGGAGAPPAPAGDPARPVDIRLATRAGQVDSKLWQDMVADFNGRQTGVRVANEEYPSAEFATKIVALSAAGSPPDVMQSSDEPFFEFADRGIWLDIGPFAASDRRELKTEDFWPGVLDFWRWDVRAKVPGKGQLFGMPRACGVELLVYNRKVFQEAGVPEPPADGAWTWADFLERARKLVRRQGDELTRAALPLPALRSAVPWLLGNGAPNTADVARRLGTLNTPASIEVLRALADYRLRERIVPSTADLRTAAFRGTGYELLARGSYAMLLDIGYLFNLRAAFTDDPGNWQVAHLPRGSRGAAARGAWSPFAAGAQTAHQPAAWAFVKFATGPEGQTTLMQLGYNFSVRKSVSERVFVDPRSPQAEERWLEATRYQHFEPLNEVYQKVRQVHNYYWSQVTEEGVRRPVNEAVRLADELVNRIYQGGDIPADWEGQPRS